MPPLPLLAFLLVLAHADIEDLKVQVTGTTIDALFFNAGDSDTFDLSIQGYDSPTGSVTGAGNLSVSLAGVEADKALSLRLEASGPGGDSSKVELVPVFAAELATASCSLDGLNPHALSPVSATAAAVAGTATAATVLRDGSTTLLSGVAVGAPVYGVVSAAGDADALDSLASGATIADIAAFNATTVFIAGSYASGGALSIGGAILDGVSDSFMFVGGAGWATGFKCTDGGSVEAVACSVEYVTVVGTCHGSLQNLAGAEQVAGSGQAAMLLTLSAANGAVAWAKLYSGARSAQRVAWSPTGNFVFVAGLFSDSLGSITAEGDPDVFLARLAAADGSIDTTAAVKGEATQGLHSLHVTADAVVLAGHSNSSALSLNGVDTGLGGEGNFVITTTPAFALEAAHALDAALDSVYASTDLVAATVTADFDLNVQGASHYQEAGRCALLRPSADEGIDFVFSRGFALAPDEAFVAAAGVIAGATEEETFVMWPDAGGPPAAVTNVTAVFEGYDVLVVWETPDDNGVAIESYSVTTAGSEVANATAGETQAVFRPAAYGDSYSIRVEVTNARGTSYGGVATASLVYGVPALQQDQTVVALSTESTAVHVQGDFFGASADDMPTSVVLAGHNCDDLVYVSETAVNCTLAAAGSGDVGTLLVSNAIASAELLDAVEILNPVAVVSVSPTSLVAGAATTITISGDGFGTIAAAAPRSVAVGGDECTDVVVASGGTELTCTVTPAAAAAGAASVAVASAVASSTAELADAVEVLSTPAVSRVWPQVVGQDAEEAVYVFGSNFGLVAAHAPSAVLFGTQPAVAIEWLNSSCVLATAPTLAELGAHDVSVQTSAGDATLTSALTVVGVPDPVEGLAIAALDGAVLVSWTEPDANGAAISGYTVQTLLADETVVAEETVTATSLTVDGLTNGVAYECTVTAHNSAGDSTGVDTAFATPQGSVRIVSASPASVEVLVEPITVVVELSSDAAEPPVLAGLLGATVSMSAAGNYSLTVLLDESGDIDLSLNVTSAQDEFAWDGAVATVEGTCPTLYEGVQCDQCVPQYYANDLGQCEACPTGATCDGGADPPVPDAGYWSATSGVVEECLPATACLGGFGADTCAAGYAGVRCSACEADYYRTSNECRACPSTPLLPIVLTATALVAVVAALAVRFSTGAHVDTAAAVMPGLGIALDFVQVLSVFAAYDFWPGSVSSTLNVFSAATLNVDAFAVECAGMAYTERWAMVQSLPLAVCLLVAPLAGLGIAARGRWAGTDWSLDPVVSLSLVMLQVVYMLVVTKALEVFDCVAQAGGGAVLETLPTQYCIEPFAASPPPGGEDTSRHATLVGWGVAVSVVYAAGIPALFFVLLRRNHAVIRSARGLKRADMTPAQLRAVRRYGALYGRFREDRHCTFWALLILARKFSVAWATILFSYNPTFQLSVLCLIVVASMVLQSRFRPYKTVHEQAAAAERQAGFFDFNRIEEAQLAASFGVLLAGLTFSSAAFDGTWKYDALTAMTLAAIFGSVLFILGVAASQVAAVHVRVVAAQQRLARAARRMGRSSKQLLRVAPAAAAEDEERQRLLAEAEGRREDLERQLAAQVAEIERLRWGGVAGAGLGLGLGAGAGSGVRGKWGAARSGSGGEEDRPTPEVPPLRMESVTDLA